MDEKESEAYIKEHINWRAELKGRERKEIPEIPIRAITETLVNSLCHRDYNNPKGNEIAIFKDRIEIYNPGQFPEGYNPEDFIKGTERSILRNPLIANTLYLSKDIERWGSGLKRIYEACKWADVKVEFKKLKSGFLVAFYRKELKRIEKTKGLSGGLSGGLKSILELISDKQGIQAKDIAKRLDRPIDTVDKQIRALVKKDLIERRGSKKTGGYWEIIKK